MHPQPTPLEEVTFVRSGGSMDPTPQERRRPPPWWWWCRIVWLVVDSTFCTIPIIGGVIMMQQSQPPPHLDTSPASTAITVSTIAAAADSKVTTRFPLSWKCSRRRGHRWAPWLVFVVLCAWEFQWEDPVPKYFYFYKSKYIPSNKYARMAQW